MASINDLSLAKGLTAKVEDACAGLEIGEAPILDHVSEITAELLKWWFQTEFQDARTFNFHPGQRQALLNVTTPMRFWALRPCKTSTRSPPLT